MVLRSVQSKLKAINTSIQWVVVHSNYTFKRKHPSHTRAHGNLTAGFCRILATGKKHLHACVADYECTLVCVVVQYN